MNRPLLDVRLRLERPGFTLDVDLHLPADGVSVLFGHSGSGKTTMLRCIAGLERAPGGFVQFNGDCWQEHSRFLPPHRRPVGYVFQEASLFPHLTARENLLFAVRRATGSVPGLNLDDTVDLLGIGGILEQRPDKLSGGERQRVAIARALLIHPRLLLMDEPLAGLDQPRKQEILPYLERLKREVAMPIIYVSHAPDEVARLADHLVVLRDGAVVASGGLTETLSRLDFPLSLGEDTGAVLDAEVADRDRQWRLARVTIPGGSLWVRDAGYNIGDRVRVRILARDISLSLSEHRDSSIVNILPARVEAIAPEADTGMTLVKLDLGGSYLIARVTQRSMHHLEVTAGKQLWAQIKSAAIIQ